MTTIAVARTGRVAAVAADFDEDTGMPIEIREIELGPEA